MKKTESEVAPFENWIFKWPGLAL